MLLVLLKNFRECLVFPLEYMFSFSSFMKAYVYTHWNYARITPVLNTSPASDLRNYSIMSIASVLARLLKANWEKGDTILLNT